MPKSKSVDKEVRYLEIMSEQRSGTIGGSVFYILDTIDTKTQSLLTHVSIMMAILSMFYADSGASHEIRLAVLVELLCYLVITLGCLRAVFIVTPSEVDVPSETVLEARIQEVVRRRKAYRISLFSTIAVTFAFLVTIATHAVIRSL